MNLNVKPRAKTLRISLIAMFIAIIAICSQISIPMTIPFTMQTFAIFLTLILLGGFDGLVAISLYILIGAAGMPVFAKFSGGIGAILGPTGGFILGFFIVGLCYLLSQKIFAEGLCIKVVSLVIGLIMCYICGTLWFMHYASYEAAKAIYLCVLPFIIPDLLKLVLAIFISMRIKALKT